MRRRQRGVALVLVMWASVILAVVAASFILERRTADRRLGQNFLRR